MPRTRQEGVSLPIPKWDWIHENHRKFGFQHKSWFIDHCIDYTLKNDKRFRNPSSAVKDLQKFDEIGNIATERRQKKFSLVKAVDDFDEDVEGLKKLHEKGWISKKQLEEEIKRSEEQHKKVVQLELSKKRAEKKRSKEWYRAELMAKLREEMAEQHTWCKACVGNCYKCRHYDKENKVSQFTGGKKRGRSSLH